MNGQSLNRQILSLQFKIEALETKIKDLSKNLEDKVIKPYSVIGGNTDRSLNKPVDIKSGYSGTFGGYVVFNDIDLEIPPFGQKPGSPSQGYNRHSHSQYSGGALDINTLQLVEYEYDISKHNPECQQFWDEEPSIKIQDDVEKIGTLDITFNSETGKWIAGAGNIDVETTMLIRKDEEGNIMLDDNGNEMSSPLFNASDSTKSMVYWDKNVQCWKFYAIFRPYPQE